MRKANKGYLDFLNVISCIGVVFLHVNHCFWVFSRDTYWFSANTIECLFYFSAPVFYMITGATLIDYRERYSTKDYFVKRIKKVLIPYLFWNMTAWLFMYITHSPKTNVTDIVEIYNLIITADIWYVYWFFIPLFAIYLSIPLVSAVEKEKRRTVFAYFIVLLFVLKSLFPFLNNLFHLRMELPLSISTPFDYLLYVLLGYYMDRYEIGRKTELVIYSAGLAGLLSHMIGTYILSNEAGKIVYTFKEYMNVPCVLYTTAFFLFVRKHYKEGKEKKIVSLLRNYTFSIYLLNEFVIKCLISLLKIDERMLLYRLFWPGVVIVVSFLITYIVRKLKFGFLLP